MLSVVAIAAPWPASSKQSFSPSEAEWIYQSEEVDYYHPVLRVKAGHEFDPAAVTATTFRRLNKYKDSWEGTLPEKFVYSGENGHGFRTKVGMIFRDELWGTSERSDAGTFCIYPFC